VTHRRGQKDPHLSPRGSKQWNRTRLREAKFAYRNHDMEKVPAFATVGPGAPLIRLGPNKGETTDSLRKKNRKPAQDSLALLLRRRKKVKEGDAQPSFTTAVFVPEGEMGGKENV